MSAVEVAAAASTAASSADPKAAEQSTLDVESSRQRLIANVEALQSQSNQKVLRVKSAAAKSIQALCAAHSAEMEKRLAEFEMEKRAFLKEQAEALNAVQELRAAMADVEEENQRLQNDLSLALMAAKTSSTNALKAAQAAASTSANYIQIDGHRAREAARLREQVERQTYENASLLQRLHEVERERDALLGKAVRPPSAEPPLPLAAPAGAPVPNPPPISAAPPAESRPASALSIAAVPSVAGAPSVADAAAASRAPSVEPPRLADNKELQAQVTQQLAGLLLRSWENGGASGVPPAAAAAAVAAVTANAAASAAASSSGRRNSFSEFQLAPTTGPAGPEVLRSPARAALSHGSGVRSGEARGTGSPKAAAGGAGPGWAMSGGGGTSGGHQQRSWRKE